MAQSSEDRFNEAISATTENSSSALFYLDDDGQRQDAAVFEAILASANDEKLRAASAFYAMRAWGLPKDVAMRAYNVNPTLLDEVAPEWKY